MRTKTELGPFMTYNWTYLSRRGFRPCNAEITLVGGFPAHGAEITDSPYHQKQLVCVIDYTVVGFMLRTNTVSPIGYDHPGSHGISYLRF